MSDSKSILVVYNTCGLRKDNTNMYIEFISSILKQKNVLQKEKLKEIVKKYYFSNIQELDY